MTTPPEIIVYIGHRHEYAERFRPTPVDTAFGWERRRPGNRERWEQCTRREAGLVDAIVKERARIAELEQRVKAKAEPVPFKMSGKDI